MEPRVPAVPRGRRRRRHGGELGGRQVDVGHPHLDAHRAALGQVDGRLVLAVLHRGQQGGQVLDRVVGLEPGRLVGDQAVAVGVALVEGVVGEGLDDVEQLVAELPAVAGGLAAGDELVPLVPDHLADLLAAGLAEVVGLGQRVARDLLGHPHDRLLVDHQPVGVAQDLLEVGVEVRDRLPPVLAVGVVVVHVRPHGPGAVQGDEGGDVVEAGGRQRAHEGPHGPTLQLEHPDGLAPAQHGEGRVVVEGRGRRCRRPRPGPPG